MDQIGFTFSSLFVAADAQYDRLVHRYLSFDLADVSVRTAAAMA